MPCLTDTSRRLTPSSPQIASGSALMLSLCAPTARLAARQTAALLHRRFPLDDLDLTPFLSSSVLRSRYGLRAAGARPAESDGIGSGELLGDEPNGEPVGNCARETVF